MNAILRKFSKSNSSEPAGSLRSDGMNDISWWYEWHIVWCEIPMTSFIILNRPQLIHTQTWTKIVRSQLRANMSTKKTVESSQIARKKILLAHWMFCFLAPDSRLFWALFLDPAGAFTVMISGNSTAKGPIIDNNRAAITPEFVRSEMIRSQFSWWDEARNDYERNPNRGRISSKKLPTKKTPEMCRILSNSIMFIFHVEFPS